MTLSANPSNWIQSRLSSVSFDRRNCWKLERCVCVGGYGVEIDGIDPTTGRVSASSTVPLNHPPPHCLLGLRADSPTRKSCSRRPDQSPYDQFSFFLRIFSLCFVPVIPSGSFRPRAHRLDISSALLPSRQTPALGGEFFLSMSAILART